MESQSETYNSQCENCVNLKTEYDKIMEENKELFDNNIKLNMKLELLKGSTVYSLQQKINTLSKQLENLDSRNKELEKTNSDLKNENENLKKNTSRNIYLRTTHPLKKNVIKQQNNLQSQSNQLQGKTLVNNQQRFLKTMRQALGENRHQKNEIQNENIKQNISQNKFLITNTTKKSNQKNLSESIHRNNNGVTNNIKNKNTSKQTNRVNIISRRRHMMKMEYAIMQNK